MTLFYHTYICKTRTNYNNIPVFADLLIVHLRIPSGKALRGNRNDFAALHLQNLLVVEPNRQTSFAIDF